MPLWLLGWEALCQQLASAFTRPTFVTFLHIATGWVLCPSLSTATQPETPPASDSHGAVTP